MIFFIVHAIFAIGMGDVKLISVLIAIMAPQTFNDISKIAILLVITSMVVAIPHIVVSHSLRLRIPWAPSLFLATILYMATR
jgi:Flp pilus assembly protein protease CpaA